MSVHKSAGRLLARDGLVLGEGRAYLHLARPSSEAQSAEGTMSLDWWNDASLDDSPLLSLADGPTLELTVTANKLSGCIQGRVLRYTTQWPGIRTVPDPDSS
jgi:hypothetical protein